MKNINRMIDVSSFYIDGTLPNNNINDIIIITNYVELQSGYFYTLGTIKQQRL